MTIVERLKRLKTLSGGVSAHFDLDAGLARVEVSGRFDFETTGSSIEEAVDAAESSLRGACTTIVEGLAAS